MPYLLGAFAIAAPVFLVVQAIRGRVRLQCCSVDASRDTRVTAGVSDDAGARGI